MSVLCSFRILRRLPSSGAHGALPGPVWAGAAPHSGIILYCSSQKFPWLQPIGLLANLKHFTFVLLQGLCAPDSFCWRHLPLAGFEGCLLAPSRSQLQAPFITQASGSASPRVVRGCTLRSSCLVFLLNVYYCRNIFLFVLEGKNFVLFFFILSAFRESSKSLLPSRTFLVLDASLYHSHFTIAGDLRS